MLTSHRKIVPWRSASPPLDKFIMPKLGKAASVIKDPSHPGHSIFSLLKSGRRNKSVKACSTGLKNSFLHPFIGLSNVLCNPRYCKKYLYVLYELPGWNTKKMFSLTQYLKTVTIVVNQTCLNCSSRWRINAYSMFPVIN